VFLSTVLAILNPAVKPELSIYSNTPQFFWVFVTISLIISVYVPLFTSSRNTYKLGILLAGISVTTVVSLPLARGYHYIGRGDALSHWGRAADAKAGLLALPEFRYPIVHTLAICMNYINNIALNQSLMMVLFVFIMVFVVFAPLATRAISNHRTIVLASCLSALMLLPVNHLGVHTQVHPASQAVMFSPVLFYLFNVNFSEYELSKIGVMWLVFPFYVLLHPLIAMDFLAFLAGVNVLIMIKTFDRDRMGFDFSINQTVLLLSFFIMGIVWWFGVQDLYHFEVNVRRLFLNIFRETPEAESVKVRTSSVRGVGGSVPVIFLKLFGVSLVYCIVLGGNMVDSILSSLQRNDRNAGFLLFNTSLEKKSIQHYTFGFVPVFMIFAIYIIQSISQQFFRHLGFMMVIVTILAPITIGRIKSVFPGSLKIKNTVIVTLLLIAVITSLPIIYGSPYSLKVTAHVTEGELHGYETMFENQDNSVSVIPWRGNTERVEHAIYGRTLADRPPFTWDRPQYGLPDHFANQSLPRYYDSPVYATFRSSTRQLEVNVWNEFRYTKEDFEYLEQDDEIQKVHSNGHIYTYYIK